eukprot:SAG22_NODE_73_length_22318_cov_47.105315_7_plen_127_part_00
MLLLLPLLWDATAAHATAVQHQKPWAVTANPMFTRFAADVSPTMPTAYPRPQLVRRGRRSGGGGAGWASLNGLWTVEIQHGVHQIPPNPPASLGAAAQPVSLCGAACRDRAPGRRGGKPQAGNHTR